MINKIINKVLKILIFKKNFFKDMNRKLNQINQIKSNKHNLIYKNKILKIK
jgi:hypothetical protein